MPIPIPQRRTQAVEAEAIERTETRLLKQANGNANVTLPANGPTNGPTNRLADTNGSDGGEAGQKTAVAAECL